MADIFNLTDSWTSSGTTYTSIKMNATDSASHAATMLMELQVGGAGQFTVSKAGNVDVTGELYVTGVQICGATSTSSADAAIVVERTGAATGNSHTFVCDSTFTKSASATGINSFDADPTLGGYVAHDHYAGFQSRPGINIGANTMTRLVGFQDFPALGTNTSCTTRRGVEIRDVSPSGTGALATQIGLFCETFSGGSANYAISIGDSDHDQGLLHVGVTGDPLLSWDESADQFLWNKGQAISLGTADVPFFDFIATADADTTSAISTLNTSGATTDHIQIDLNGTKAWIAVSTNSPS